QLTFEAPAGRHNGPVVSTSHHHPDHVHDDVDDRVAAMLELLRTDGGRVTTGRRAIVHALMTAPDHHVTAEDIAAIVQADQPDMHLSTVYRTLDALVRLGSLGRLSLGPGAAVYHLRDHAHHHFVCEGCGAVVELDPDLVAPWVRRLASHPGLGAGPLRLTVGGRCTDCAPS
ncbi:MAG: Fur family transcriptional regulator, partial [Acidimicrobiia bacterium]